MALYERKLRHADSENMVIFEDKQLSENAENAGYRKTKTVLAASRAPLQDCTTAVENTRTQHIRSTKQVARPKYLKLKSQSILLSFSNSTLRCCRCTAITVKLLLFCYSLSEYCMVPSVLWRCWLGGRKGIRPVKTEWWGLAWLSVWSEVQTCTWPGGFHCHSLSLASVKSRLVSPFWYQLTRVVPEKGPLNGCVCVLCLWSMADHWLHYYKNYW